MAKSKEINMNLPSADDLFTTQEERDQKNQEHVKNISVYDISDFPNHPFKVKMDDKMVETIESIRDHGVYMLGKIPNLHSLIPYSLNAHKPVYKCNGSDGLTGEHISKAKNSKALYNDIIDTIMELL